MPLYRSSVKHMKLTLRNLVKGSMVAFRGWMLPDGSLLTTKISQQEYIDFSIKNGGKGNAPGQPDPNAVFLMSGAGIQALDTQDGWPSAGDCWEETDDNGITRLVIATGADLDWNYNRAIASDPGKGLTSLCAILTAEVSGHRYILDTYDLKSLDQIVVPQLEQVAQAVVDTATILNHKSVTFDASASASTGTTAASSLTYAHPVASQPNTYIGIFSTLRSGQTFTSATYNGTTATTQINFVTSPPNGTVRNIYSDQANPSTGTHNVVVTFSAATSGIAGSMSAYGVNQSTPLSHTQTNADSSSVPASPANITITSAVGELVLANTAWEIGTSGVTVTFDPAVTPDWNLPNTDANPRGSAGCHIAGASSITISNPVNYPSTHMAWCMVAVSLKAAATVNGNFLAFM